MNDSLHMVQMFLPPRLLISSHGQGGGAVSDAGYQLHSLFAASFGDLAPKPFHHQARQRQWEIVAYSSVDAGSLLERAQLFGKPDIVQALETGCSSKPMPIIATGMRLGFSVNVVPTVRAQGPTFRKGAEIDAWVAAMAREKAKLGGGESSLRRELVYAQWLQEKLARHGGVQLEELRLRALRGARLLRRDRERKFKRMEQREAVFQGVLRVTNQDAFFALLKRGIGRHRAFGFGMILLSPPPMRKFHDGI
ncbi:MAG: CRISPR-associated CT1974 family protein [Magnetococcales bacterium]|nr:CRISPR-associated CT1974 family protein [Magnetococcales bacterium]